MLHLVQYDVSSELSGIPWFRVHGIILNDPGRLIQAIYVVLGFTSTTSLLWAVHLSWACWSLDGPHHSVLSRCGHSMTCCRYILHYLLETTQVCRLNWNVGVVTFFGADVVKLAGLQQACVEPVEATQGC